jgi:cell wall-associated NlpC family hydrolase
MKRLIPICILLMLACTAHSQRVDTIDYSYLKFGDIDTFYTSKGINIVNADNPDLYFEIFDWLNTPYHWGGKSKYGVDCSGFVGYVFNKLYNKGLSGAVGDIYKKCTDVIPTELQEGDLLFFNINGRYMYHVGIYLQNGMFAHAAVHGGVIISSMEEKYYQRWFYKAGRLKDE